MTKIDRHDASRKTYYVPGSGLIAVPTSRVNEIQRLKAEYHTREVQTALMAAFARKPA